VNFYCETLEHAVNLAKAVKRDNVGTVFNLCHFLKVEGESGLEEKVKAALLICIWFPLTAPIQEIQRKWSGIN
jgi:hypothetical protein